MIYNMVYNIYWMNNREEKKPIQKLQYDISVISKDLKLLRQDINYIKDNLAYIKHKLNDVTDDKPVMVKEKTQTQISTEKGWFW
jgi:hypothetical protein